MDYYDVAKCAWNFVFLCFSCRKKRRRHFQTQNDICVPIPLVSLSLFLPGQQHKLCEEVHHGSSRDCEGHLYTWHAYATLPENVVAGKPDPLSHLNWSVKQTQDVSFFTEPCMFLQSPTSLHRTYRRCRQYVSSVKCTTITMDQTWAGLKCYSLCRRFEFFQGVSLHFSRSSVHLSAEKKKKKLKILATAGEAAEKNPQLLVDKLSWPLTRLQHTKAET